MRRPRTKLQVSTFPFLAVLLCAMGALLLLLFLMDRRAKIAARNTASEAIAERKKRSGEEEAARQAEWEKARELLHQSLLAEQDKVTDDASKVRKNLSETAGRIALAQAQHVALDEKVKVEKAQIALLSADLDKQRTGLGVADLKDARAKKELLEAAKELAELESAFRQVKTLRDRDKSTAVYSLVPYRGKRGDQRTPIYVECTSTGVLLHPEKKPLDGLEFAPEAFRREVERQAGPLEVEKSAKEKSRTLAVEKKGPYVLFLIRPEGILSYYKAQSALAGYQVDFGYEFVDAEWVLDFGGDPNARPASPGPLAKNVPERKLEPIVSLPPIGSGAGTPGNNGGSSGGPVIPGPGMASGNSPLSNSSTATKGPAFVPINRPTTQAPTVGLPGPIGMSPGGIVPGQLPSIGTPGNPPAGGDPQMLPPISIPAPGTNVGGKPSGQPGGADVPPQRAAPDSGPMRPLAPIGQDPAKTPPSPPSRILGNKDFIITIDCYAEHVTITPSGLQFRWTAANAAETDAAVVKTVTTLIARRQDSVRLGEPPYRPVIRFQVAADGLRTFHRVHPILAPLRLAMTRENVDD